MMHLTLIEASIWALLTDQFGVDSKGLTLATDLRDDLGLDSLDIAELIMHIDRTFQVDVKGDELPAELSIRGLAEMVLELQSEEITEVKRKSTI